MPTTPIAIATTNEGKKNELLSFFSELENIQWKSLIDFNPLEEPEETGETFEANALQKAIYYGNILGETVLAEDSGFILEAFPEKFGLNTRRQFEARDDIHWLEQFLEMMEFVENRKAVFYSALAYYNPKTKAQKVILGSTRGEIEEFPQTPLEKGIPVSSVFRPEGFDEVYSAMTKAEKNKVSHRGKACQQMAEYLKKT